MPLPPLLLSPAIPIWERYHQELGTGRPLGDSYIDDDTITLTNITQITNRAITDTTGTLTVARGGTGQTSFGQGWLNTDGTTLSATTSPTVNYITATSTTATSTFAGGLLPSGSSGLTVLQNGRVGIGTVAPGQHFILIQQPVLVITE